MRGELVSLKPKENTEIFEMRASSPTASAQHFKSND